MEGYRPIWIWGGSVQMHMPQWQQVECGPGQRGGSLKCANASARIEPLLRSSVCPKRCGTWDTTRSEASTLGFV